MGAFDHRKGSRATVLPHNSFIVHDDELSHRRVIFVKKKKPVARSSEHGDDYAVFTELLSTVRKEQGVTQTTLAEHVGRLQTWVAKVEAGDRRIDAVELIAVLDALKVDLTEFFIRLRRQLRKKTR
jgi:DNA-binding XRE family transcriptional regulator